LAVGNTIIDYAIGVLFVATIGIAAVATLVTNTANASTFGVGYTAAELTMLAVLGVVAIVGLLYVLIKKAGL
jgi:hypothetical protein